MASRPAPAPDRHPAWIVFAALSLLVLGGLGWRLDRLENRPLHADEAVQAWQTWNLLRGEGYRYDPLDRHGPSLYFGAAALQRLSGGDATSFDDAAARRFSLLAGGFTLLLLGVAPRLLGVSSWIGCAAAALLATETLSTLYHTYFVQEATLALLVWSFLCLLFAPRTATNWIALGLVAGLAQATKEIAPAYLLMAWMAVRLVRPPAPTTRRGNWLWGVGAFLIPFLALYSSLGANPIGVFDAFRTYVLQATRMAEPIHHYPWWHIFRLLGIVPTGGPWWGQYVFLTLGLTGLITAFRPAAEPLHRAGAILTVGLLGLHTMSPYKTPWLLLTPTLGLAWTAAFALHAFSVRFRFAPLVASGLVVGAVLHSAHIGRLALDRYPGDARNPYFYEQAPRAFLRLPTRIDQLAANVDRPLRLAVVSDEHAWPLPWYLRHQAQVGYFDGLPPSNLTDWDIVIWDSQRGEPPPELGPPRMVEFVGLRPQVLLTLSIAPAVWEATFPSLP